MILFSGLICALFLPFVVGEAQATLITTGDGNGADAFIQENEPTNPHNYHGIDTNLFSVNLSAFLRFDISDFVSGSFANSASLQLTSATASTLHNMLF